jgi:hypothetical protein
VKGPWLPIALLSVIASGASWRTSAAVAPSLGVRNGHVLAYDAGRGRVVLFGGADEREVRGELWEWSGKSWRLLAAGGPPPRTFAALAYDRAHKRLILFGGNRVLFGKDSDGDGDPCLDDMWEWSGSWRRLAVKTPPARAEASMVYDSARGRLVLFGGYRGSGTRRERFGDTWEWDGSRWEQRATPSAPSPRNGAAAAFDEHRKRVVLFGGGGGPNAETWEWDGSAWARVEAPTAGRYNTAMVYDRASKEVFRFGGWNGKERVGDSWRYDGKRWEEIPGPGPEPRNHASMAYDEKRGAALLIGGHDGEHVFGDTWQWRDGTWSRLLFEAPRARVDIGH